MIRTLLSMSSTAPRLFTGERGGSVVECRTPEREVGGSRPTATVLCPWARHFTPRKYWLITQEAVAPSRHDWKIVDWDIKPQHKQTNISFPTIYSLDRPRIKYIKTEILNHWVSGSKGGEILFEPNRRFITQCLSFSPFHRPYMTEILLKGT